MFLLSTSLLSLLFVHNPADAQVPPSSGGIRYKCSAVEPKDKAARLTTVLAKALREEAASRFDVAASAVKVKLKRLADSDQDELTVMPGQSNTEFGIDIAGNPPTISPIEGQHRLAYLDGCDLKKNYKVTIRVPGEESVEINTEASIRVQGVFKPSK
jgi:hypothetical protein